MDHFQVGHETGAFEYKPKLQDLRPDGGEHKDLSTGELGRELGFNFNETNGLEGNKSAGQGNEQPNTKNRAEAQSLGKSGEGPDRKMEVVYHRWVKQPENVIWKVKENGAVSSDGSGESIP